MDGRLRPGGCSVDPCASLRLDPHPPGKMYVWFTQQPGQVSKKWSIWPDMKQMHPAGPLLAWARSQVELRYLNLSLTEAHLFRLWLHH